MTTHAAATRNVTSSLLITRGL